MIPRVPLLSLERRTRTWVLVSLLVALVPIGAATGADVTTLVEALASSDARKRRDAAYALHQLGPDAVDALPALITALDDDQDQVFFHAVSAIAKIGPDAEPAIPALIGKLERANRRYSEQVYLRSEFALSRIGAAAVEPLRKLLCLPDEVTCANAIDTLALMPPEVAAPAVEEMLILLGDERERVSDAVIHALANQGMRLLPTLEEIVRQQGNASRQRDAIRTIGLIGKNAKGAGAAIAAAAGDGDAGIVIAALDALVRIRHDAADTTRLIITALRSPDESVANAGADAALLLAQIDPSLDTRPFAAALEQASEPERLHFATVLGRMGEMAAPAVPQLIAAAAQASSEEIAQTFAAALGNIGAPAAPLVIAAAGEIPADQVNDRCWAVTALARAGEAALGALRKGLQADNPQSRMASAAALGLLGPRAATAADDLFAALKDPQPAVRGQALAALPRVGVPSARMLPLLKPLAADSVASVRQQAFRAMGNITDNGAQVVPQLHAGLEDPEPSVRASAIAAAGNLGAAANPLVPQLTQVLQSEGEITALERAAIVALGKIGPGAAESVPALLPYLDSDAADVRLLTLSSLGQMGKDASAALPELREALSDPVAEIRAQAVNAIADVESEGEALTTTLLLGLDDADPAVQGAAVNRLAAIGESAAAAAPRLFQILVDTEEPQPIIEALRNIRTRDFTLYVSILSSKSPSVRLFACEALGRFGGRAREALPELEKLKDDEYDFVRRRAIQAIERIERQRR